MKIQKIKDWIKSRDEIQFEFIRSCWVKRLSDGQTFKAGECVFTNTPESPLCTIGKFDYDRINVWVDVIGNTGFFLIPINKIKSISPNLSYKTQKRHETF